MAASRRPPLTHFLCIPLVTPLSRPMLDISLQKFRSDFIHCRPQNIVAAKPDTTADAEWVQAIRPPGTMHLTLGVMTLSTKGDIDRAVATLQALDLCEILHELSIIRNSIDEVVRKPEGKLSLRPVEHHSSNRDDDGRSRGLSPLVIALRSLEAMHVPKSTSVVYALACDQTERLKPFCERLRTIFMRQGLLSDDARPLKLHATVANTIYARLVSTESQNKYSMGHESRQAYNTPKDIRPGNLAPEPRININPTDIQTKEKRHDDQNTNAKINIKQKQRKSRRLRTVCFDARPLLQQYKDFEWVPEIMLDRIAICEMGAKEVVDEDGISVHTAYREISAVKLLVL